MTSNGTQSWKRPRIAICDYIVSKRSPSGSCHLAIIERLCEQIDFTVFAAEFKNPRPDRIHFVRVRVPTRPLALLYLAYHVAVLPVFFWTTLIMGRRFDLVQSTETYSLLGDVSYSHFCHKHYLKRQPLVTTANQVSRWFRWLDHRLRSLTEGFVYRHVRAVVVPSLGLERELLQEYSIPARKVKVINNPVDLEHFARPIDFDADAIRKSLGMSREHIVATFVALGHFERKGLFYIFSAMQRLQHPHLKLLIVGGQGSSIAQYRRKAEELGISTNVKFVGMQDDVRPFLWCSDLFVFPSHYEVSSLVTVQAAAAGLPILASRISIPDEFVEDEVNGLYVDCSSNGVQAGLSKFLGLTSVERENMGCSARTSVRKFDKEIFGQQWADFYAAYL
jgi:glycosyltransferase involved in cell wall biosynthesis